MNFGIGTPCHENWDQMTPQTQGRFCDACQKCVVDLTQKTQTEIKALYVAHEGNMCGRMKMSQLTKKKSLRETIREAFLQPLTRLQKFGLALLLMGMVFGKPAQAQQPEHVKMGIVMPSYSNQIYGRVTWEDGSTAAGMEVILIDDEGQVLTHAITDDDGNYSISGNWYGKCTVRVSGAHTLTGDKEFKLERNSTVQRNLKIEEQFLMGDIAPEPPRLIEPEIEHEIPDIIEPSGGEGPDEEPEAFELKAGMRSDMQVQDLSLSIYPNPTVDQLFVVTNEAADKTLHMRITDAAGQAVYETEWRTLGVPVLVIPTGVLPAGVYFLQCQDADIQPISKKFVKVE